MQQYEGKQYSPNMYQKFEMPVKSVTPNLKSPGQRTPVGASSPSVAAHREYQNLSNLEIRNP